MARLISSEQWGTFKDSDGRYDGLKFERLVGELLSTFWPGNWKPTPRTHDGSKDFVLQEGEKVYWAECKAYRANLSLHTISPTLVMALIDGVKKVMLFSRSRLNENAIINLSRYRRAINKDLQVFDGRILDELIVSAPNIYQKYFNTRPPVKVFKGDELASTVLLDRDPVAGRQSSRLTGATGGKISLESSVAILRRNEMFSISITLRSLAAVRSLDYNVKLLPETVDPCLAFLGIEITDKGKQPTLEPAEIDVVTFYFRARQANREFKLPIFEIRTPKAVVYTLPGKARIRALYQIELVGKQAKSLVEDFTTLTKSRNRPTLFLLTGRSGVGKSRLAEEFSKESIVQGYKVQQFNAEFQGQGAEGFHTLLRQFLANVNDLPRLPEWNAEFSQDIERLKEELDGGEASTLLLDYLYSERDLDDDTLVALVCQSVRGRPTAWILDNAQNVPDRFADFAENLLTTLENWDSPLSLVYVFNSDFLLPNSRWISFMNRVSVSSVSSNWVVYRELNPFDREDAGEFLESALKGTVQDFGLHARRNTLELFLSNVEPKPLNLWQTLMYLSDRGALRVEDGELYVRDPALLRRLVRTVPPTLVKILDARMALLVSRASSSGLPREAIWGTLRAQFLVGRGSLAELRPLGGDEHALEFLQEAGLIKEVGLNENVFFHHQLFLYFSSDWRTLLDAQTKQNFNWLSDSARINRYYQQALLVGKIGDYLTDCFVDCCGGNLLQFGASREYGYIFCKLLGEYFSGSRLRLNSLRIEYLTSAAKWLRVNDEFGTGLRIYRTVAEMIVRRNLELPEANDAVVEFTHDMANALLATHDDSSALEVIELGLRFVDKNRAMSRGQLLNRKMATLKALGLTKEALAAGEEALRLSSGTRFPELSILNLFDLASIFKELEGGLERAVELYQEGLDMYKGSSDQLEGEIHSRCAYVQSLIMLLEADYCTADRYISQSVNYARVKNHHFWGIRLCCLQIARDLLAGVRSPELLKLRLSDAEDWWISRGVARLGWIVRYLEAKVMWLLGEPVSCEKALSECLATLRDLAASNEAMWRRRLIYHDIGICYRELGERPNSLAEMITHPVLLAEVTMISQMSEGQFQQFKSRHLEGCLLKSKVFGLPIV